jgi:hypothetical protein
MKMKSFLLPLSTLALLVFSASSGCSQTVITFDDIPLNNGTGEFLANNYHGLVWSNFAVVNGILNSNINGHITNGFYYGVVSPSNVAIADFNGTSEIDSPGTNLNFLSAYLTGGWNSNLNIEVQGFNGTNLLYDTTVVASATNPTLFAFNYLDINRLSFTSSGGQPAFGGGAAEQIVMDNFTFEFVPEPSSLLLATAGALLLCPLLKRKRA